jgi:acetylornithine/succinyldiaminopimelate/putrescine aminotransferase
MPAVREVRQRGFMVGIELADLPLEARMGHQVALEARRRGAIVRPLGDVVVLMPPLSISVSDLARLVEITMESIAVATVPRVRQSAESSPGHGRGTGDPLAAQRPGANRDTAVA